MAFPWNNNKNNSRWLEEVAVFCPSETLLLTPWVMASQRAVALQTHSQSRRNGRAPSSSGSTGDPIFSSGSRWRTMALALISCALGGGGPEKTRCYPSPSPVSDFLYLEPNFCVPSLVSKNTTHRPWRQIKKERRMLCFSKGKIRAPGWLSRLSVRLRLRSRSQGSWARPASGSVLTAQSLEPASDSVCPSLSAPSLLLLCLALSKINKYFEKIF